MEDRYCELVPVRCSAAPGSLQELEEDFFTLIAEGEVCNVKQFLKKHRKSNGALNFNPNCINFENQDAMSIAIDQGNIDMIKYLSHIMDVSKRTILLKAVYKGDVDLVRSVCEVLNADAGTLEGEKVTEESTLGEPEFTSDITPLILAAIEGHFEIIGYLIERGHYIDEPHRPDCMCDQVCLPLYKYTDSLDLAMSTLHLYAAISNPVYFIYITCDPIHYAFKIHHRLITLAKLEKPFRCYYEKLARRARKFAACLVSECWTTNEVELVLKSSALTPKKLLDKISHGDYPRLLMAYDYDQYEFLSEPKVQLVVQEKFFGSFKDWKYFSNVSKCCYPLLRLFTIPSAYFNFLFYPSSKSSKFYASPINKMLHFLAMHLVFLIVLFLENKREKPCTRDKGMQSYWGACIFFYFCGFAGVIFHQFLHFGSKRFCQFKWNRYDLVVLSVYSLSIAFEVASIIHANKACVPNCERKYWASLDPQLMSEGFAVLANVMAFMKLLFFSQVHRVIGPLQVGLCRMVKSFVGYSVFGVALVLAYSTAFSHFYSYYSGMIFTDPVSYDKFTQEESFIDWLSTFKTFFWGAFTLSDVESADVVIENSLSCKNNLGSPESSGFYNQHLFTQFIGYLGVASFTFFMIMIIKNMLIATMIKVYESLMDNFHKTWLVRRMEIFLYFFTFPVMPPPFNLLPQAYGRRVLRDKLDLETACKERCFDLQKDYLQLVRVLVQRYFNRMNKPKDCEQKNKLRTQCGVPVATFKPRCHSL